MEISSSRWKDEFFAWKMLHDVEERTCAREYLCAVELAGDGTRWNDSTQLIHFNGISGLFFFSTPHRIIFHKSVHSQDDGKHRMMMSMGKVRKLRRHEHEHEPSFWMDKYR